MAQKPNHSSSEEEENDEQTSGSDSDEVSDSDSGEKSNQEPKKALIPPQSATKRPPPDLPSSESEESDADSYSPPKTSAVVDSTVKPISSVSIQSKMISTPPPAKSKRPPPAPAAEKDAKKAKQNTANGERKKPVAVPDLSSSEEELSDSGTGNDSDSVPPAKRSAVADPNVKPISSKPMEREVQTPGSKSAKISGSKSVSTPPAKRKQPQPQPTPAPSTKEEDLKKGKKNAATDDDSKKQLFQRLWSEDDEIVVLQGMIDFKSERNGKNRVADAEEFPGFIRKSLHVDVSRTQLVDKIRRLKKKYVNNASNEKKDGKDIYFAKNHEQKLYELSKLIWDGNNNSNSNSNTRRTEVKKNQSLKNGNSKATVTAATTSTGTVTAANVVKSNGVDDKDKLKMVVKVEKKMDISRFVQYGVKNDSSILSEEIVKAGMELVEGSKRAELEAKWKNLMEQELELYVKRMELLKEQALMVLEVVKSSGN